MRGLKQEWLAEQTGLPSTTVSRIVNGARPTLRNAQKIARALGVSVDDLCFPQLKNADKRGVPIYRVLHNNAGSDGCRC
ncbi:MAG: helix-turn-helix transcriptional regulator [Alicyclobacillus macrosporangiidus]|nr:helix-turn-helix transcriptional regulator [Alicyclobacillus macrosporangiidus]